MTLDEIKKRRAAIDGAPWEYETSGQQVFGVSAGGCNMEVSPYRVADIRGWGHLQYHGREIGAAKQDANGIFIANAPADIDFLLAEIAQMQKRLGRWEPKLTVSSALTGQQFTGTF